MTEQEVLEAFLKRFAANPVAGKRRKVVISDGSSEEVLFETSKQVVMNDSGALETVILNKPRVLDDGSSITGVSRCQKCSGLVRVKSLHRCPCGRTTCVRRGCAKIWDGTWFCSLRCVILFKLRLLRRF